MWVFFFISLVLSLIVAIILAYMNDPYFRWTRIQNPFITSLNSRNEITLTVKFIPKLDRRQLRRAYAFVVTGFRIPLYSLITIEKPISGSEDEIIKRIHEVRFNPDKPYVITGSHYPDLYMRNMGVFFNALLDPRLPTSESDWLNRQQIALQTVAYDLAFLAQNKQAVTTIIPLGFRRFTGLNIYKQPSDALFAVLYALKALTDEGFIANRFPIAKKAKQTPAFPLQTKVATTKLITQYQDALSQSLGHYLWMAVDDETGLIARNVYLSSARDGIKRDCSFYDNVIAWATIKLADELGIKHTSSIELTQWKQHILEAYWDKETGIFRDDLRGCSAVSYKGVCPPAEFSADSFIVTSSGFFDLKQKSDRQMLEKMVTYVEEHGLDQPFPLSYAKSNNRHQMHGPVRFFAPSYMGDGIWSHWGMEYIKSLILLGGTANLKTAKRHLTLYKQNIESAGGYPELYDRDGTPFKSVFMRGVLHTGWVVNYEQARMMVG